MTDYLNSFEALPHFQTVLTWAPAAVLLLLALWLLGPAVARLRKRRQLSRTISHLGPQSMKNVILDNGMDGYAYLDYLVLTPEGLIALAIMDNHGSIFGARGMEQWAQINPRHTLRFANPVDRNNECVLAVRAHVPEVEVSSRILFSAECDFPKGRPDEVVQPADIPVRHIKTSPWPDLPAELTAAWERLREIAQHNTANLTAEIALLKSKKGRGRVITAILLLLAAVGWVAWRYFAAI